MRSSVLAALLAAACAPPSLELVLPTPPLSADARALIVAAERDGALMALVAVDLVSGQAPVLRLEPFDAEGDSAIRLHALESHASLAALGLRAGSVALDPAGALLPEAAFSRFFIAEAAAAEPRWALAEDTPPFVRDTRMAREPYLDCPDLVASYPLLETMALVRTVVPLGDDEVLLTTDDGLVWRLAGETAARAPALPFFPSAAFRAADGELWFADSTHLWRGRYPGPFVMAATHSLFRPVFLVGPREGAVDELFLLDEFGSLERWDGARVARLADLEFNDGRARPQWIAPGMLAVSGGLGGRLFLWRQGELQDLVAPTTGDQVTGLGYLPAQDRLLAGTHLGLMLSLPGLLAGERIWRLEPTPAAAVGVNILAPAPHLGGGLLLVGSLGEVAFYRPDAAEGERFCPGERLGRNYMWLEAPMREGFIFGGGDPDQRMRPAALTRLTRR